MDNFALNLDGYDYSVIFRQILQPLIFKFLSIFFFFSVILLAMLYYAMLKYKLNFFKLNADQLRKTNMHFKLFSFIRWKYIDLLDSKENGSFFDEYGFTIYCGRQGAGKTISMVYYLERMKKKYPDCKIVTNFTYDKADYIMSGWKDFFDIRNGIDGVIFAIDEIHSEYSNDSWKDFPEELLSEISQQRKQRVKIVATSQVYSRVVKQIREQCFSVIQCKTFGNRWTFTREYDALEYEQLANSSSKDDKLKSFRRINFVQGNRLRLSYDTFEKIERLEKMKFISRDKR